MTITKNYFQGLIPGFQLKRTSDVVRFHPAAALSRKEAAEIKVDVYDYNADTIEHFEYNGVHKCEKFRGNNRVTWINIDGLRKADVEMICNEYGIHSLLIEDILSVGQRPKMDELENVLFCLLNMLYFNEKIKLR